MLQVAKPRGSSAFQAAHATVAVAEGIGRCAHAVEERKEEIVKRNFFLSDNVATGLDCVASSPRDDDREVVV